MQRIGIPGAQEIAVRAQELKVVYLALTSSLPTLLDPQLPILQWELARLGTPSDGDFPVILRHHDGDPDGMPFSIREILTKVTQLQGDVLGKDLMSISMMQGGIRLGDMILKGGHLRKDVALMQFVRHFRNACAHGDRWEFFKGEPLHPAICRELVLTQDMHGKRATWETVSPLRYVQYLDDLSNYFRPGWLPDYTLASGPE